VSRELIDAMVNMQEKEALAVATGLLEDGEDPLKILDYCKQAMEIVGKRFEEGTYFLPELMMAGEILAQISSLVKPRIKRVNEPARLGRVLIGTVEGDIHDIGKDIVTFMLDVNEFDVRDLGIDVPAQKFVEEIKEFQPKVVGLSGFLTLAFDSMKATVDVISSAGLRDEVKIMIGGGQIDDEIRKYTGADAYGLSAMDAVNLSKRWTGAQ
jgi:5-methyltetrahydrofolate--homocysteine methyltransferase